MFLTWVSIVTFHTPNGFSPQLCTEMKGHSTKPRADRSAVRSGAIKVWVPTPNLIIKQSGKNTKQSPWKNYSSSWLTWRTVKKYPYGSSSRMRKRQDNFHLFQELHFTCRPLASFGVDRNDQWIIKGEHSKIKKYSISRSRIYSIAYVRSASGIVGASPTASPIVFREGLLLFLSTVGLVFTILQPTRAS